MSSRPNTIFKLTRWRVRDIAACFFACKMSERTDDSEESKCYTSPVPVSRNTLAFDPISDCKRKERKKKGKKLKLNRTKNDKEKASARGQIRDGEKGDYTEESNSYCFKEEDQFIVFSFDSEGSSSHDMINGKRQSEHDKRSSSSFEDIDDMNVEESSHPKEKNVEGEESSAVEEMEDSETRHGGNMLSARESSDSVHSDTSTGSFAFPIVDPQFEMGRTGQPCPHAAAI